MIFYISSGSYFCFLLESKKNVCYIISNIVISEDVFTNKSNYNDFFADILVDYQQFVFNSILL